MSEQLIQTPCAFGENGNFLLERELGSGGMGGVYMGRDKMLDRPVAVKVMLKELGADAEFVGKFKREAQSAAKLIHPNIAQVYSYGICDGMPYIAMELAAGGSLYSIMNANPGKTDVARVIKICQQVAQALQCASDQGFVHGDVKPENILLDANGNAKLVDFGLAAMQKDTNEIWGTPYYISPEKVKKEQVDFRADMYSLGGTLYHALTGVAPFEGSDSIAVVKKRFEGLPKKPSEVRAGLTPAIDELVMKMLALDKADRYPSFEALIEAFKTVMTSGLTAKLSPVPPTPSPAKPAASATGAKRMVVRGHRTTMSKVRPGATSVKATSVRKATSRPAHSPEEDEEESGGNLGAKVFGAVFGGILLIGAVIGGLVWYQVADRKARAAEEQAQIATGIAKARAAIGETLTAAGKFADDYDEFAAKAVEACQKPTDELTKILPAAHAGMLKPGPNKELLDAIASTNVIPADAQSAATSNAVAVATNELPRVAVRKAAAKARPRVSEEYDPAAPQDDAPPPAVEAQTNDVQQAESAPQAPAVEEKKPEPPTEVVIAMGELWDRTYSCQACAIRIRQSVRKIIEKGAEAEEIKVESRENMEKLAELSRMLVDMFEQVKASKDVETIRKGISYIKSRGEKTVDKTVKQLRREKLEAERAAKKEADAKAEKERLERLAAERKAKGEAEVAAAKAKFNAIVAQGAIRQLDWKNALSQLKYAKDEMTTPEGQLAFDLEIRKVNDMKGLHDLFIKHIKGHAFKGKLSKHKVADVNEKEVVILKPDGKNKFKVLWQTFFKDYPGNLNELINTYVVNVRKSPDPKVKMTLKEWGENIFGAALIMQLVCGDVNGAMERSEALVKEVVKEYQANADMTFEKTAHEIFPDIKFEAAPEE